MAMAPVSARRGSPPKLGHPGWRKWLGWGRVGRQDDGRAIKRKKMESDSGAHRMRQGGPKEAREVKWREHRSQGTRDLQGQAPDSGSEDRRANRGERMEGQLSDFSSGDTRRGVTVTRRGGGGVRIGGRRGCISCTG